MWGNIIRKIPIQYGKVLITDKGYAIKKIREIDKFVHLFEPVIITELVALHKIRSYYAIPLVDYDLDKSTIVFPFGEPFEKTKEQITRLCLGIADIHNKGFLHCDIKEENLLKKWIIDFGLCYYSPLPYDSPCYTLWYRAPELLLTKEFQATRKSDVWALGVTIANILLGKPFLTGDSDYDQLLKIFRIFGTPQENKEVPSYPNVAREFFKEKGLTEEEIDLLLFILVLDPKIRPTIFEILRHPYFKIHIPEWNYFEILLSNARKSVNNWEFSSTRKIYVKEMISLSAIYGDDRGLALGINLLDRTIPKQKVFAFHGGKLLHIIACLIIGLMYYNDGLLPNIDEIGHDIGFYVSEIIEKVREILIRVKFDLTVTTPYHFLYWYKNDSKIIKAWKKETKKISYLDHPLEVAERIICKN